MTLPEEKTPGEKQRETLPGVTIHGLQDAKRLMKAVEWHGKQNVKVTGTHAVLFASFCFLSVATSWLCIVRQQGEAEQEPVRLHRLWIGRFRW